MDAKFTGNGPRTASPTYVRSPWHRRAGILCGSAAAIAGAATVISAQGEPVTTPAGSAQASTLWSVGFSLIATDYWEPAPAPPPPVAAPPPAPAPEEAPAPRRAAPRPAPVEEPQQAIVAPPPPPPPQLKLWFGPGGPEGISAFASIANNDRPTVGCTYNAVAVSGAAALVNYNDVVNFAVNGSAEARIDRPGPPTGSNWHVTVTCDNGLSTAQDVVY
ncbi:hypothetical protein [Mycolicibacterium neworleansense]|uniref:Uncharacterized protein n=1 Tax=Mycolicibacterium neworleansense TaxID=146018 RepID=A0A0H5RTH2_9MYCO|nr:hypothetical protein [Mycolicibacterium neworleansense]MCV7361431.1 hypothetical protein [Mycolicibacterium neworleansense]CRZ16782.1 hypothetical protein BN2156_03655 [Mycolicibacterium neworleansense]